MTPESRIDAVEHLVLAILHEAEKLGVDREVVAGRAAGTIMGSDGPGGPSQKSLAVDALKYLLSLKA